LGYATQRGPSPPPSAVDQAKTDRILQKGSIFAVATFFGGVLLYQVSPKEGQSSGLTNLITRWTSRPEHWEEINATHALAVKQAGFDRTLFEHSPTKDRPVEVAYPEYVVHKPAAPPPNPRRQANLNTGEGLSSLTARETFAPATLPTSTTSSSTTGKST
jgi:hypothetical protein